MRSAKNLKFDHFYWQKLSLKVRTNRNRCALIEELHTNEIRTKRKRTNRSAQSALK